MTMMTTMMMKVRATTFFFCYDKIVKKVNLNESIDVNAFPSQFDDNPSGTELNVKRSDLILTISLFLLCFVIDNDQERKNEKDLLGKYAFSFNNILIS